MRRTVTVAIALGVLVLSCTAVRLLKENEDTRVDKADAVKAATEYARAHGWAVEEYVVARVDREGPEYWVLFDGKSRLPGDHFSVWVDAATGRATRLFPGA